jgi:serine/threonine-protein kinase
MADDQDDVHETMPTIAARNVTEVLSDTARPDRAHGNVDFIQRYTTQAMLGQGGMGDVFAANDSRIGREVAMKMMRPHQSDSTGEAESRFLREARVQGQLEHPAIVPVYDLGVTPLGENYFTMRKVRGATLRDVIKDLREKKPGSAVRYSPRKLLSAFSNICLAIDYAHQRGIIHRDLKPANIMLGDFGEVYVIDWGLAKVIGGGEDEAPKTAIGAMLGTAGYVAPEQARGSPVIDARADVYALGAILFEILTLEPLIPKTTRMEMVELALRGVDGRPSVRAPRRTIPPELDAICVAATKVDPNERLSNARLIHEAIERHLDGDRDMELRRELAASHVNEAEELITKVLSGGSGDEEEDRSRAMQRLGRVLALDPESTRAADGLARLMLHPPSVRPKQLEQMLETAKVDWQVRSARFAVLAYLAWFLFAPLFVWMGVRDWTLAAIAWGCIALISIVQAIGAAYGRSSAATMARGFIGIALSTVVIILLSRLFGPLVFVPALATANAISYLQTPFRHRVPMIIGFGVAGIAVPLFLEVIGFFPSSYLFKDGMMCIVPQLVELHRGPALGFILAAGVGGIVVSGLFVSRVRDLLTVTEEKLAMYTWHLEQMLRRD